MFRKLLLGLLLLVKLPTLAQSLPGSGNSLTFDGFSQYISCGTAGRGITSNVTVEAWVKTTATGLQFAVTKYENSLSSESGFEFGTNQGKAVLYGRVGVNQYLTSGLSSTFVSDGRWHHLAGQVAGNTWRIYVDGVLENSTTYTYTNGNLSTPANLTIGTYFYVLDYHFQGEIDEVQVWRTARTTADIQQSMCRKFATAPADLVAYYRLDQRAGLVATDQGSQPTNGSLVSFSGSPWHLSGAPLGDASVAAYQGNNLGNLRLKSVSGDSAVVSGVAAGTAGVQLYTVASAPSIAPSGGGHNSYFGVFTTGEDQAYVVRLRAAQGLGCAGAQLRTSNDLGWETSPAPTTTATSLLYGTLAYRGEYILTGGSAVPPVTIRGDSAVCANATGQLTAQAAGATGYQWSTGATTATIAGLAPGTYSVTARFAGGCTATNQATIRQARSYVPTISGDSVLCPGAAGQLRASAAGPVTYRWSTGATSASIAVSQAGIYTVTATSPAGCSQRASYRVRIAPTPTLTITGNTSFCPGSTTQLTAVVPAGTAVRWSTGATSLTITVTQAGTYSVVATSAASCTNQASVQVQQRATSPVTITGSQLLCANATGQLTAQAAGATSYRWNTGATTATITGLAPGTYSVTANFAGSCTTTAQATIGLAPTPTVTIGGDSVLCPGAAGQLRASAAGPVTYRWSTGATSASIAVSQAGTYTVTVTSPAGCSQQASYRVRTVANPTLTIAGNLSFCSGSTTQLTAVVPAGTAVRWSTGATSLTIAATQAGTYSVVATAAAGCTSQASVQVQQLAAAAVTISGSQLLCAGTTGQLTAAAAGATSYQWSTGATTATITGLAPGTYSVTARFAGGCTTTAQAVVGLAPAPTVAIGGDSVLCAGAPARLTAMATNATAYRWSTGATTASIDVTQAALYTVLVTSAGGCTQQAARRVRAGLAAPIFALGADTTLCEGNALTLSGPAGAGLRYQWSDGSTGQQLLVAAAGTYTLQVITECGTTQSSRTVEERSCLTVPNVFTPNGDHFNEQFVVQGLTGNDWSLDVYDRWGRAVLHTSSYHNDWGQDAAPGVYYVLLRRPSTGYSYKGWVEVLREGQP